VNWGQWHGPYALLPERLVLCAEGKIFLWQRGDIAVVPGKGALACTHKHAGCSIEGLIKIHQVCWRDPGTATGDPTAQSATRRFGVDTSHKALRHQGLQTPPHLHISSILVYLIISMRIYMYNILSRSVLIIIGLYIYILILYN
jgi:hypothetical protein